MYIRIIDIDHPGVAATGEAGDALLALIAPAIANGEVVELDFEGVQFFSPLFFYWSVGKLIEADTSDRVQSLLRYTNLNDRGQMDLDSGVELAIRRRDPRWAWAMGVAAEKLANGELD